MILRASSSSCRVKCVLAEWGSYLVGACTGRTAGFSPLRIRSTYRPAPLINWQLSCVRPNGGGINRPRFLLPHESASGCWRTRRTLCQLAYESPEQTHQNTGGFPRSAAKAAAPVIPPCTTGRRIAAQTRACSSRIDARSKSEVICREKIVAPNRGCPF